MRQENDYQLDKKIKIDFEGMPYWVMPRYVHHYVHNQYEKFSLQIVKNMLSENSTFLDIGAHYGAYSLFAAKNCNSKVISIEPVKENFELLSTNIKANKLNKSIETHNVAASDKNGTAEFNIPWASDSAGFYEHPLAETIKKQKVTVKKIDDIVKKRRVDLLKIDTEGHELKVLDGLKDTLADNPQLVILIEANPSCLISAGSNVKDLLTKIVNELNKEIYVVDEEKYTLHRLTDRIEEWEKYIKGYANILCVPKASHQYALFVCHSSEFGGAELAMIEHIVSLRSKNILSHVVLPYGGGIEEVLIEKAIGYTIFPYSFWSNPNLDGSEHSPAERDQINIEASAQVTNLAKDIAATFMANNSIVCPWGQPAAKALELPLVWFVHEFGDLDHRIPFAHNIGHIRKFIVEQSDLVVCCSESVREILLQGKESEKAHTVYYNANEELITTLSNEEVPSIFSSDKDILKLSFVGRIKPSKGQIYAIRAVHELNRRGVKAELALIGPVDEEYGKEIQKEINDLQLNDQIIQLGFQKNPHPYVRQADAVVVASINEAFGRITAEAMIIGKPVVGTNTGGTAEMIKNGVTGLTFEPANVKDLADKLIQIQDIKLANKLSKNAKGHILALLDEKKNINLLQSLILDMDYKKNRSKDSLFVKEWTTAVNQEIVDKKFLRHTIKDFEAVRLELQSKVEEASQTISRLEIERHELSAQLNSMINSTSWKVTRPSRLVSRIARRAKRTISEQFHNIKMYPINKKDELKYSDINKQLNDLNNNENIKLAVVLHLFYVEAWQDIKLKLNHFRNNEEFDLFVTMPEHNRNFKAKIKKDFKNAHIFVVPNRGRDVLPFMQVARHLSKLGYEYVLKLHSKKSPHRKDGENWFKDILDNLIPSNNNLTSDMLKKLKMKKTGIIGPKDQYVSLVVNHEANINHLKSILDSTSKDKESERIENSKGDYGFFAGTMFWTRLEAIQPILDTCSKVSSFELEGRQIDGTYAHALERAFSVRAEIEGRDIYGIESPSLTKIPYKTDNIPDWSNVYIGPRTNKDNTI